jgi:large subunit ribosomal protein L25
MATNQLKMTAEPRETGKSTARELRRGWGVPAVIYGPKIKPISASVHLNDALRYSKKGFENSIFTFESKDSTLNGLKVLRKSMDIHPVTRRPIHMDFFAPDMTQKVRVEVEVRLAGKAKGTAEGGLVSMVRRTVEIECLPLEIPEFFELDVTEMGLNESMHVSDIKFPENLRVITSQDETIASCAEVKEEIIAAPTPEAAAAVPGAEGAAAAAPGAAGAAAPGAAPAAGAPAAGAAKAPAGGDKEKK